MKSAGKDVWTCTVKGDLKGDFYTFNIGKGETPGVFAKAVGRCGKRGAVIDLKDTNPTGWASDHRLETKSMADLVIYELHYRDFSIDPSSGLVNKGKFLCLTEDRAIDHLKELGINAVHVLPSFDFASVDENKPDVPQYNWGYDPLNYNVPEGSYSYDAGNPTRRIFEFKSMVEKLHERHTRYPRRGIQPHLRPRQQQLQPHISRSLLPLHRRREAQQRLRMRQRDSLRETAHARVHA